MHLVEWYLQGFLFDWIAAGYLGGTTNDHLSSLRVDTAVYASGQLTYRAALIDGMNTGLEVVSLVSLA